MLKNLSKNLNRKKFFLTILLALPLILLLDIIWYGLLGFGNATMSWARENGIDFIANATLPSLLVSLATIVLYIITVERFCRLIGRDAIGLLFLLVTFIGLAQSMSLGMPNQAITADIGGDLLTTLLIVGVMIGLDRLIKK